MAGERGHSKLAQKTVLDKAQDSNRYTVAFGKIRPNVQSCRPGPVLITSLCNVNCAHQAAFGPLPRRQGPCKLRTRNIPFGSDFTEYNLTRVYLCSLDSLGVPGMCRPSFNQVCCYRYTIQPWLVSRTKPREIDETK